MVFELPISTVPTTPIVLLSPISKISISPVPDVAFISRFPIPVSPPITPWNVTSPVPDEIVRFLFALIVVPVVSKVTVPLLAAVLIVIC